MGTVASNILDGLTAGQPLSPRRVEHVLSRLAEAAEAGREAATLYLSSGASMDDDGGSFGRGHIGPGLINGTEWREALARSGDQALRSPNGIAAFRVGELGLALHPPFPLTVALTNAVATAGIDAAPLRSLLAGNFTVGVALVRLGRYAIAVYEGERLSVSKTDTRYVKGKHHAGGTSQRRFQRVRENQIHRLYKEASSVLENQWRPWVNRLDYVILGGEAATVAGFVNESDMLQKLAPITLERRLDVREPNRAALDRLGARLYECRVYPLRWDT